MSLQPRGFLTLAGVGGKLSTSFLSHFTPNGNISGTYWEGHSAGSNPTRGTNACVFILCLCCAYF
jgi:hypothetical protein